MPTRPSPTLAVDFVAWDWVTEAVGDTVQVGVAEGQPSVQSLRAQEPEALAA